ncbi:MAG: NAD(P)-binding domain-containing protein [Gemmatimonadaceae bacterium]|nr:NAD(P)-binding domain-containing protein [Gemmatimonadaceae bacterium]
MRAEAEQESRRIAVLGAGYIGSALAAQAAAAGHAVWAVRRSAVETAPDGVTWLRGSVAAGAVAGLPAALDLVVLTVAPSFGSDGYESTYPPAAAGALAIARATGAGQVIYTSSTGVYGGQDGAWVTEASPRLGRGAGNDALIAAEDILLQSESPSVHVLRVAGIYGPGRDPRARMRDAAALPERGEYWTNLAHRDDIVGAILHVAARGDVSGVFNVSDGQPALAADVSRWLAAAAGADPERLVFANEAQRSRNNQRVSSAALQATGWVPRYASFREGFSRGL